VLSTVQRLRVRLGQSLRYLRMAARSLHPKWYRTEGARPRAAPREPELLARLEEYNAAAEHQWQVMNAEAERRSTLLEKPLASLREAPAMLYRLSPDPRPRRRPTGAGPALELLAVAGLNRPLSDGLGRREVAALGSGSFRRPWPA
jgi:hypothetical protein